MWGVQKNFFRSLHSRIRFCSRTFRTVVLPLQLWSERVKEAAWQLCARGHARIRVVIELLSVVTPFAPVLDMYRHRLLLCTDDGKYFGSNQVDSALTYVFINQFESNRFTGRPVLTRFISNLTDWCTKINFNCLYTVREKKMNQFSFVCIFFNTWQKWWFFSRTLRKV